MEFVQAVKAMIEACNGDRDALEALYSFMLVLDGIRGDNAATNTYNLMKG